MVLSLALFVPSIPVQARGSDAALGAIGGLAIGTMFGAAASSNRGSARRAEIEARRAQTETEQLRREQQLRRDVDLTQRTSTTTMVLVLLIVLLFLAMVGFGVMALKKR